jgi:thiol-disulfide isomerase/thioredoxin
MSKTMPRIVTLALMCGWLAFAGPARAEDRTADQIVEEMEAITLPQFDISKRNDQDAIRKYITERTAAMEKRSALIGELLKAHPDDARLARLLPQRWQMMLMASDTGKGAKEELDGIIADGKNKDLVKEAAYYRAILSLREGGRRMDTDAAIKAIDEFGRRAEKDPRVPSLMYEVASMADDPDKKKAIFDRITKEFPSSPVVRQIEAARRQLEGLGKPFELEFTDAIKDSPVSIKGLKGKVVVIDFWATWCGPCIAEMPKMKDLYAKYRDKGVEFIGVSLDQPKEKGGLDKLKEYVQENKIEWPQYYQGNFWQSDFSSGWGVNSIPCVFLVDADGKLASVDARGKLEEMIPEYLLKAKAEIK